MKSIQVWLLPLNLSVVYLALVEWQGVFGNRLREISKPAAGEPLPSPRPSTTWSPALTGQRLVRPSSRARILYCRCGY
jgi:hypothetical protein